MKNNTFYVTDFSNEGFTVDRKGLVSGDTIGIAHIRWDIPEIIKVVDWFVIPEGVKAKKVKKGYYYNFNNNYCSGQILYKQVK